MHQNAPYHSKCTIWAPEITCQSWYLHTSLLKNRASMLCSSRDELPEESDKQTQASPTSTAATAASGSQSSSSSHTVGNVQTDTWERGASSFLHGLLLSKNTCPSLTRAADSGPMDNAPLTMTPISAAQRQLWLPYLRADTTLDRQHSEQRRESSQNNEGEWGWSADLKVETDFWEGCN